MILRYRKTPKISRGAYIIILFFILFYYIILYFLRGLFLEGPIFGGAYVRREICVSKSIGLACSGKEIYHFCFVLLCIRGQIPSTSPPGAYIRRSDLTEGFLRYDFGGLIFGGAYFRNFTVTFLAVIDTRRLCTRLRTDGWFLRGQTSDKTISHYKKSQPSFFILEDNE